MGEKPPSDYDIGYGKPPKSSQFKKGKSGNPKGRPRKKRGGNEEFDGLVADLMAEKIPVTVNGERQERSRAEMVALQLTKMAMEGDLRAVKSVVEILDRFIDNERNIAPDCAAGDDPSEPTTHVRIEFV